MIDSYNIKFILFQLDKIDECQRIRTKAESLRKVLLLENISCIKCRAVEIAKVYTCPGTSKLP